LPKVLKWLFSGMVDLTYGDLQSSLQEKTQL
jgi:hypothetical protein